MRKRQIAYSAATQPPEIIETTDDLKIQLTAALARLGDTIQITETLLADFCLTRRTKQSSAEQ